MNTAISQNTVNNRHKRKMKLELVVDIGWPYSGGSRGRVQGVRIPPPPLR